MARSRNIKPGIATNEELNELDPLARWLFVLSWTIADYNGNFEWRPKKLKLTLLGYDDCDISELAINLERSGFFRFYSDGNKIYVHIVNFTKHQNPHKNEKAAGTDIPEYSDALSQVVDLPTLTINPDKSRLIRNEDGTAPADSLIPHPDSLNTPSESEQVAPDRKKELWKQWADLAGNKTRSLIGKLIKDHGEESVLEAIEVTLANHPVDPVAYITATLRKPPEKTEVITFLTDKGVSGELATKYFNSRASTGWKRGNTRIVNWIPDAQNYIDACMEART